MAQDEYQIICIQEHHLDSKTKNRYHTICNKLQKRYMVVGHPAVKHRVGNRGGVLILVDKVIDARPYKEVRSATKMWAAIVVSTAQSRGSSVSAMIGTVYLPPGEDALNMATLHDISTVIRNVSCPFCG